MYSNMFSLSPSEALSKKKQQPRQIQTSNAPPLPQHALGGPAGSAPAPPPGSAHGPVHVLPGSYVAARSTAASLPALMQHTVSFHWMPRRYRKSSFHHYQLWKSSFLLSTNSIKEAASKVLEGKQDGGSRSVKLATCQIHTWRHLTTLKKEWMDWKIIASGICRPIICSTLCLVHVFFFSFAWDFSWLELMLWRF